MKAKFDRIRYGGDYNPEQWADRPDILEEDLVLMKKAHINTVTLGVFSWAKLEPEEGVYHFDWLEEIIGRLYAEGISTVLATPSGARPRWLAEKYPEVLRMNDSRQRNLFGMRHNHCYTSPVYRKKVREIDMRLAERFDSNPAVILWHVSNEYVGECHCPLCQQAFRGWLKERYHSIDEVNRRWNTAFWSHTYTSFDQIESPTRVGGIGEFSIGGLNLDWRKFVSHQTTDFCRREVQALRDAGAEKPTTTNLMYDNPTVDHHELADAVDIVSWDSYPSWHHGPEYGTALDSGMAHDVMRSLKRQPFLLMESCPGATSWQKVSKLRRPGMVEAASLQAVAHGSESVMYFQIRKNRSGFEKLHGAVIDHYGKEDDRTFQECRALGENLEGLSGICGSRTLSETAVVYDWMNRWALEGSQGPRNEDECYKEAVLKSHSAFRKMGLNTDVIDMTQSLERYRIVAAPMTYLFREGFAERVRKFVADGGILILTYWSGIVDENDSCFLGGTPHGLMDVAGLRSTELDALYDGEGNTLRPAEGSGFSGEYACEHFCQLVDVKTAEPLFVYGEDFYAGTPALTVNRYGKGLAYYVCADAEQRFYDDLYAHIAAEAGMKGPLANPVPEEVEVSARTGEKAEYIFVQNWNRRPVSYQPDPADGTVIFGDPEGKMEPFGTLIFRREI